MDKFNVIDQVNSLDDLERDYEAWSSLPYAFRRHSDDDCIRKHGMTNQQFYDKVKAELLNGYNRANYIGENYNIDEDYLKKVEITKQYTASPNITILIPYSYKNEKDLVRDFEAYQYLGYKSRLMSDEYSRQIWGYTVQDIFTFEKERLSTDKAELESPVDESVQVDEYIYECNRIKSTIESMIINDDKVGLMQNRIHQYYNDIPDKIREAYESEDKYVLESVNQTFNRKLYDTMLPKYVPYFTPDEMLENSTVEKLDYRRWKDLLIEAVNMVDEERMLELGWNPSVAFTTKNIEYARERQLNWLENRLPKIINIQGISTKFDEEAITESSESMREYYRSKNLYPIFIVLSFSNSTFGNVIRAVKGSTYTHAGIATDSDLSSIYSFNFGREYNGFTKDTLDRYLMKSQNAIIDVLCIFVDGKTKFKIDATLSEFERHKRTTRYSFGNILNMLFNRVKNYPYPENLSLVCSQFVDLILKLANIDLINKPNNLVLPQDFAEISKNPKVFKVYEGYARNYNDENVEKDISILFSKRSITDIRYNSGIKIDFSQIADKSGVIESLNIIDDLLKPDVLITERFLPIRVNDKGDVTVEFRKDLEQQYQECHKLLKSYTKDNLVGIKHELAHLFYLNSTIETKVKKMKKNDNEYKSLMDLRARILNDFKTYIKIVNKEDPEFNFSTYFQDSEYYNGAITVDHGLMKLTGNMITRFLSNKF